MRTSGKRSSRRWVVSAVPKPSSRTTRGLEGDRVERGDLQVLVARDLLEDLLEVAVGVSIG